MKSALTKFIDYKILRQTSRLQTKKFKSQSSRRYAKSSEIKDEKNEFAIIYGPYISLSRDNERDVSEHKTEVLI